MMRDRLMNPCCKGTPYSIIISEVRQMRMDGIQLIDYIKQQQRETGEFSEYQDSSFVLCVDVMQMRDTTYLKKGYDKICKYSLPQISSLFSVVSKPIQFSALQSLVSDVFLKKGRQSH